MKSTNPITYHYEFPDAPDGRPRGIAITRRHVGTAYASNGNVGNPTEYFVWDFAIDGGDLDGASSEHAPLRGTGYRDRTDAYEHARARLLGIPYCFDLERPARCRNVRPWVVVKAEMQANYRRREVLADA